MTAYDPSWILKELGIDPPSPEEKAARPKEPPMSREEIDEMMQKLLREELKRCGLLDPEDPG